MTIDFGESPFDGGALDRSKVGQVGSYQVDEGLWVDVEVLDVRTLRNVEQLQVRPVSGAGTTWVSSCTSCTPAT